MDAINHTFKSYYLLRREVLNFGDWRAPKKYEELWEFADATVSKIRLSSGYKIDTFRKLVEVTARTSLWNTQYEFFFRGQSKDYQDKNGKTIIYPTICRPEKR